MIEFIKVKKEQLSELSLEDVTIKVIVEDRKTTSIYLKDNTGKVYKINAGGYSGMEILKPKPLMEKNFIVKLIIEEDIIKEFECETEEAAEDKVRALKAKYFSKDYTYKIEPIEKEIQGIIDEAI